MHSCRLKQGRNFTKVEFKVIIWSLCFVLNFMYFIGFIFFILKTEYDYFYRVLKTVFLIRIGSLVCMRINR